MTSILLKTSLIVGTFGIKMLPQTVFLNMRRKFRARYGFDDKEIPIREDIQQRIEKVMDDLNIPEKRRNIQFFNVHDVDAYHAGFTATSYGALVGIPVNFEYQDVEKITDKTISLQYSPIEWSTEPAKQFRDSLILSENAQKFAIALKILTVHYTNVVIFALFTADGILGALAFHAGLQYFKITKKQRLKQIYLFCAVIVGIYALTFVSEKFIDKETVNNVNAVLSSLGSDYIEGGIEYYEKLSKRNKALRVLLGERGKYVFTSDGNELFWFFNKSVPISQQLNYFSRALQTMSLHSADI